MLKAERSKQTRILNLTTVLLFGNGFFVDLDVKNTCIFVYQKKYAMNMIIETTSRQFRERQKDFFDMADSGQKIVIKRGRKQAYVLTPVSDDDLYFTPEMIARIKESQKQIKEGKSVVIKTKEELDSFFDSL